MKNQELIDTINKKRIADDKFNKIKETGDACDLHLASKDRIIITLNSNPYGVVYYGFQGKAIIILDQEDINYFYNKYSKLPEIEQQQ